MLADRGWPETGLVTAASGASSVFAGFRFPREVISVAVCWYLRYGLSCRDVEKLTADRAHQLLAPRVTPGIRYDLHMAMITHGRTVCRAQQPRCDICVLRGLCAYGSATGAAAAR